MLLLSQGQPPCRLASAYDKASCYSALSIVGHCLRPSRSIFTCRCIVGGDSTGQPLTTAIEHAINMLLARVAFDLLRSPKFKQQVVAHIQKKLDELKVPDYINALQVYDLILLSKLLYQAEHVSVFATNRLRVSYCLLFKLCSALHVIDTCEEQLDSWCPSLI